MTIAANFNYKHICKIKWILLEKGNFMLSLIINNIVYSFIILSFSLISMAGDYSRFSDDAKYDESLPYLSRITLTNLKGRVIPAEERIIELFKVVTPNSKNNTEIEEACYLYVERKGYSRIIDQEITLITTEEFTSISDYNLKFLFHEIPVPGYRLRAVFGKIKENNQSAFIYCTVLRKGLISKNSLNKDESEASYDNMRTSQFKYLIQKLKIGKITLAHPNENY